MRKLYSIPGLILSIVFLAITFYFVSKSMEESKQFKESKSEVAEILNFNDRLLSAREWMFSEKAWNEKKIMFEAALIDADEHYTKAKEYGHYILYTSLVFFIVMIILYFKRRLFFGITMALSIIGLALLVEGITNPILEMAAFKEELTIKVYVKPADIPYFEEAVDYMGTISDFADYIKFVPVYGQEWADGAKSLVGDGQEYLKENGKEICILY